MAEVKLWSGVEAEIISPADRTYEAIAPETQVAAVMLIPGPEGPAGEPGPAMQPFVWNQETPSATWIIDHDLGMDPTSVQVLVDSLPASEFGVAFPIPNQQVRISFDIAVVGTARLL